ncbi:hypothetical protein [Streptomyces badius]
MSAVAGQSNDTVELCSRAPNLTRRQARLLTAHHEAAHAVVAVHHGLVVTSLELQECEGGGDGWSVSGITFVTYYPQLADEFALQGAAGELAALKWLNQERLEFPDALAAANADHDRDEIIELLAQDGIQVDWAEVRSRAHHLVDALWMQIGDVARAAAEGGHLTGREIVQIQRADS